MTLPPNTPDILRAHGLKVRVVPGWRKRGRPGPFAPAGVLVHHTATSRRSPVINVVRLLIRGRSDLPGPLSQFGLTRKGVVWLIAAGRCNHAGTAKSAGSVAGGDGNRLYIGIEGFNTGVGEPWPPVQYKAFVLLAAVLSVEITRNSVRTVNGHKETSVTGKIDPRFDMDSFRLEVAVQMDSLNAPRVIILTRGREVEAAIEALEKAKGTGGRRRKIDAALSALHSIKRFRV